MKYKEISEGKYSFCIDARKASSDGLAELQGKLSSLGYNLIDYYRNSGCTGELTFTMNQFPYFGVLNGGDAVVHSDPKHFDLLSSNLIEEAHFLLDNGCLPEEFSLKEDHPSKEVSLEVVPGGEKCPFPEEITVGGDTYKVTYEKIESAWWVGLTSGKYLVRSRLVGIFPCKGFSYNRRDPCRPIGTRCDRVTYGYGGQL